LFTIVPHLVIAWQSLPFWSLIAACYFVYTIICFTLGWIFHLFIDEPSILIGKWLWDVTVNEWPTTQACWKAGIKNTFSDMWAFYKRAAWTMVTCGCAGNPKRRKAAATENEVDAPVAAEPVGEQGIGLLAPETPKDYKEVTSPITEPAAEWSDFVNGKKAK
jgi:hypothetical protein